MSLHNLANHLASHGRNGDSTLVHMTKGEVAGLQALARRNGTTLTINPHTGLPEAFSLKSLLPLAAGFALGPAGWGIAASAMEAGLMVGGATALATGDLKKGLMAGLGAYGGAGLGGAGAAAGSGAGATEAGAQSMAGEEAAKQAAAEETAKQAAAQQTAQQTAATNTGMSGSGLGFTGQEGMTQANTMGLTQNVAANGGAQGWTMPTSGGTLGEQGVTSANYVPTGSNIGTSQSAIGSGSAIPAPAAAPAPGSFAGIAANAQAHPSYLMAGAAPVIADEMAVKPAAQQPDIKSDSDMGQRWGYSSGYDNSVPGRTGPATYTALSNEEAKKRYGFAEGGDVKTPYSWQQENESVVRMADGGSTSIGYEGGKDYGDYTGYGISNLGDYSGYDAPVKAGIASVAPAVKAVAAKKSAITAPAKGVVFDPVSGTFIGPGANAEYLGGGQWGLTAAEQAAADAAAAANQQTPSENQNTYSYAEGGIAGVRHFESGGIFKDVIADVMRQMQAKGALDGTGAQTDTGTGYTYDSEAKRYTPNMASGGGISSLGSYSDGGRLLKGPGDGMSDNIPAQIGHKQPARLADGEFVVPADVVSHLGNGSTDAGAKQLYSMMDKIRQARTGRKAQGKQINPSKFLPA